METAEYGLSRKRRCKDAKLHFAGGQLYPADSRVALGGMLDLATCWPGWKAWAAGLEQKSVSWLLEVAKAKTSIQVTILTSLDCAHRATCDPPAPTEGQDCHGKTPWCA